MPSVPQARPAGAAPDLKSITLQVPARVHAKLADIARAASQSTSTYAATLLMAAYTARVCAGTGDRDLDDCVARVVVLDALEVADPDDIARHVRLAPDTVRAILKAWRDELAGTRLRKRRVA